MSKSGASSCTFFRSNVISPEVSERGKERIFVVESLSRYVLLSVRCARGERNVMESSYSFPRIASLIYTKGKRGSLPFVLFLIVQNGVSTIGALSRTSTSAHWCFTEFCKFFLCFSTSEAFECCVLYLEF